MDSTPDQAIIKCLLPSPYCKTLIVPDRLPSDTDFHSTVLPKGSVLVSTARHGKTNWADGFKIEIETKSQRKAYFVKVSLLC